MNPIDTLEAVLEFYANCPIDDGMRPAAPNPRLTADSGDLARKGLKALEEIRWMLAERDAALLRTINGLVLGRDEDLLETVGGTD